MDAVPAAVNGRSAQWLNYYEKGVVALVVLLIDHVWGCVSRTTGGCRGCVGHPLRPLVHTKRPYV